ncbi:hypothetical protein MOQ_004517 [Trypanosoma cruzi marinkellei]|uniref:CS domain-containing protein n=1 Tax=Trypanosoma cruzi marinkellei TaxID=85056 RepID=K2NRQ3_TRYCR|nr:hypothetical protein MOQ_004517 [Trypanosoma cruzi marinkellei]
MTLRQTKQRRDMTSGIDYSKWEKFCESDESDGSDGAPGNKPRITRLKYPSRVTVGPNGVHMENTPPIATTSPFNEGIDGTINKKTATAATTTTNTSSVMGPHSQQNTRKDVRRDDEAEEDEMMYHNLTRNGGREGQSHLWSQTRDTASVSFILPSMSTRAKEIMNFRLYSEEQPDRTSACVLTFGVKGVEGERRFVFRYPIKVDNDVVEGCWQLHSLHSKSLRLMVVQLVKESVAVGMALWWDRCFVTDQTTVDTRTLVDRSGSEAVRGEQFQRAWEEAHEEFKKRVNERHCRQPATGEEEEEFIE